MENEVVVETGTVEDTNSPEIEYVIPAEVEAAEAAKAADPAAQEPAKEAVTPANAAEDAPADPEVARQAYRARRESRQNNQALQEINNLKAELEALRNSQIQPRGTAQSQNEPPKRPDPSKYELQRWDPKYEEDVAAWQDAHAAYVTSEAIRQATAAADHLQRQAMQNTSDATLRAQAELMVKRGIDKDAGFLDTIKDAFEAMPPSPEAMRELVTMSNAEDVLLHLARRPQMLEKLTAMTPMGQALELGKISARIATSQKVTQTATKAKPTPTTPSGANGAVKTDDQSRYERMLKAADGW